MAHFNIFAERLQSLLPFQKYLKVSVHKLANAGFYGYLDGGEGLDFLFIRCHCCEICLYDFEKNDDPIVEHLLWSFVYNKRIGESFSDPCTFILNLALKNKLISAYCLDNGSSNPLHV